jgi:hypothetical protein
MNREYTRKYRRFVDLILDAVVLLDEATKAETVKNAFEDERLRSIPLNAYYLTETLSRASVMASVASLECAANCCVESMSNLPSLPKDSIDKLPTLDKLDVFYCHQMSDNSAKLDRGSQNFQIARELIQIRNWYVHPKTSETAITIGEPIEWSVWKLTTLEQSAYWRSADALKVLDAVIQFFNWFFLDVCHLSPSQTSRLLLPSLHTERNDPGSSSVEEEKEYRLLKSGHDIRFLDLAAGRSYEQVTKEMWQIALDSPGGQASSEASEDGGQ